MGIPAIEGEGGRWIGITLIYQYPGHGNLSLTLAMADRAATFRRAGWRPTIPLRHLPSDKYVHASRAERRDRVWNPVRVDFYEILTLGNESADTTKHPLREEVGIVLNQDMVI